VEDTKLSKSQGRERITLMEGASSLRENPPPIDSAQWLMILFSFFAEFHGWS
jgi:hypothetical protein